MQYRKLGNTDLTVSALGFGGSPLGGGFRPVDEAEAIRTVHTALDLGLNFIDTSPYYGVTRSEILLGKALRTIPRDRYVLATKVGRYGMDDFDFSAARITRSVDESIQRLGVDHIDLIQCHDIEFGRLDQVVQETLPALRRLCQAGKVRWIGITGLPLQIYRYVLERTEVDTILSYCHYSLNDTALEGLLPTLTAKQLGIINAAPLSMGLLTDRGAPDWHPASADIRRICAAAAQACRQKGLDIQKLALQFSVSHPAIHTTLVGSANAENMRRNVEWVESPVDPEALATVQAMLAPIHNQTWLSGRPENNDPIPAAQTAR